MLLNLTALSAEPLFRQISSQLARRILDGDLAPGAQLPSLATLARQQHVSRSTVRLAYAELAREGLIRTLPRKGPVACNIPPEKRGVVAARLGIGPHTLLCAIEAFSTRLMSIVDKHKMCSAMIESLADYIRPSSICIAWPDGPAGRWSVLTEAGGCRALGVSRDDPLLGEVTCAGGPVAMDEKPDAEAQEGLAHELRKLDAGLIFPLTQGDSLLGLAAVGGRGAEAGYSEEDLNILSIFAGQLATAFAMADMYAESLERRRMEQELRAARRIQANLLPGALQDPKGLDVAAFTGPAGTVGGDFYDYFPVDSSCVGLIIADACGNGVQAAMLISQIQATVKSEVADGKPIEHTLNNLNRHLQSQAETGFFATLFYGIIDTDTGVLEYANAGHDLPILVRRNGRTEVLASTGPALGVVPDLAHETGSTKLGEGDCLVLYTDGITEVTSPRGRQYGEARLKDMVIRCRHRSPDDVLAFLRYDVERFSAPGPSEEDMTLMVIKLDRISASELHVS